MDARARNLLIVFATVGTFAQANHMRPQVFSLLAFCWMLVILKGSVTAYSRGHLFIPLIFAAWGNLHGGWMVGGLVLALWTMFTIVRPEPVVHKVLLFANGGLALAATLVNPYGWHMWEFLWRTVGFSRADITDWQPVYRLEPGYLALWCATSVAAAIALPRAWRSSESGMRKAWRSYLMLAAGSLQVSRLLAFYTLGVVILLGADLASAVGAWRAARPDTREVPPGRPARTIAALYRGGVDRRRSRRIRAKSRLCEDGAGLAPRTAGGRTGQREATAGASCDLVRLGRYAMCDSGLPCPCRSTDAARQFFRSTWSIVIWSSITVHRLAKRFSPISVRTISGCRRTPVVPGLLADGRFRCTPDRGQCF